MATRNDCINAVLNENNIAQEISHDDNDDDEEVDETEDETLSFIESLKMLDKIEMKKVTKCYLLLLRSWKICSFKTKSKSH